MVRKAREKSSTGIYHIMLRGINRQDIFNDDEDRIKFRNITGDKGTVLLTPKNQYDILNETRRRDAGV